MTKRRQKKKKTGERILIRNLEIYICKNMPISCDIKQIIPSKFDQNYENKKEFIPSKIFWAIPGTIIPEYESPPT